MKSLKIPRKVTSMSVHSTAYIECPECEGTASSQVNQFEARSFRLDDSASLADDLTAEEMRSLRSEMTNERFSCLSCNTEFIPYPEEGEERLQTLAYELFHTSDY